MNELVLRTISGLLYVGLIVTALLTHPLFASSVIFIFSAYNSYEVEVHFDFKQAPAWARRMQQFLDRPFFGIKIVDFFNYKKFFRKAVKHFQKQIKNV